MSPPDYNEASEIAVTGLVKALCVCGAPSVTLASDQTGSVSPDSVSGRLSVGLNAPVTQTVIRSCYKERRRLLLFVPTGLFM